jgi:hypothetical protein
MNIVNFSKKIYKTVQNQYISIKDVRFSEYQKSLTNLLKSKTKLLTQK